MRLHVLPCAFAAIFALASERPCAYAQAGPAAFSSSTAEIEAPAPGTAPALQPARSDAREAPAPSTRAFRSVAIEAKIGSGGVGFDVATPLNRFLNLRGGAQFFDDTLAIKADGIHISGDVTLQNVGASVDYFPFRRGGFFVSAGVTVHNDNHVAGPLLVPGGQAFSLGDADSTSDPSDPVTGFARAKFGNTVAPRFTVGWGNMLPRSGRRFSFPFEVGFQYTSPPTIQIVLQGNSCNAQGCGPVNDSDGAINLQSEIQMLQSDLNAIRFFPIVSTGISYKFGR